MGRTSLTVISHYCVVDFGSFCTFASKQRRNHEETIWHLSSRFPPRFNGAGIKKEQSSFSQDIALFIIVFCIRLQSVAGKGVLMVIFATTQTRILAWCDALLSFDIISLVQNVNNVLLAPRRAKTWRSLWREKVLACLQRCKLRALDILKIYVV